MPYRYTKHDNAKIVAAGVAAIVGAIAVAAAALGLFIAVVVLVLRALGVL